MKQARLVRVGSLVCAAALGLGLLGGCASSTSAGSTEESAQSLNRQYMSDVNQIMADLGEQLESFTDAVAREDVVSMTTQAENAFEVLDELEDLEAPDDLAAIHEDYLAGAESLEEALDAYVKLYTEIETATDDEAFDWSTYDERLVEIQELYDEGIGLLESADEAAAAME